MSLPDDLAELVQHAVRDDRLWITPIVRMEGLYSARTRAEHIALEAELDALRIVRNDRAVADGAMRALPNWPRAATAITAFRSPTP